MLQLEDSECGAACLGIVLGFFGRWVSIEELRDECSVGRDGCSAADIAQGAERYGLKTEGWRRQPQQLRNMALPVILFWEFNHFVVLEGFDRGRWYVNDPANGHRTIDDEEFDQGFTGVVLAVKPGPNFRPGGVRPGIVRRLWPWLRVVKTPLAFAMGCGVLLAVPALALPLLLSVFVDYVLSGREPSWGGVLVGALAAAGALLYLLTWLRQRCLRLLALRLSVEHADRFIRRLFRLPMRFFAHRFSGDLTSRVQLLDQVATVAASRFAGAVIELVTSLLLLVLMFVYDAFLGAVVASLGVACVALTRMLTRSRVDENRRLRREQGKLSGIGMFGLRKIDTLQAVAAEDDFYARWTGYQARELLARQRFTEFGYVIGSLPSLFLILGNVVVLGLGGWRVMSGDMSVGMLMGFYVIAANFLQPIGRFVQLADMFQMLEADLQRLDDILDAQEDPTFRDGGDAPSRPPAAFAGRLRLSGQVELRHVTFGYQGNREPLLRDFNLAIDPGQRVAVVGPSGSGKSTLALLVAGIHQPWSGEILFDGHPRNKIPRELLSASVSCVDQHIFLFAATVRENLTLWDPAAPDQAVAAAGKDAAIHEAIMSRVLGYDARVEEGGRNFSGGQRQRLEIARALVGNPSVLILDEATSALDARSEMRIDDALRRRGCTCLIVAHRLSTIRDCDLIVVLDKGREVQRGTHPELMEDTGGLYHQLMKAS